MLFHVAGGYTYIDPYGVALGYEGCSQSPSRQADTTSRSASEKTVSGGWSGGDERGDICRTGRAGDPGDVCFEDCNRHCCALASRSRNTEKIAFIGAWLRRAFGHRAPEPALRCLRRRQAALWRN
jgi:hypothetical protein